jgi:hypothetical protein
VKIILLDAHNPNYDHVWQISHPNKLSYCNKHGYTFVSYQFGTLDPPQRTPHWGRVLGIQKYLPECDWLFYLDTDIIIMNDTIRIERFVDEKYNLIIGPEAYDPHISTSGMLFKNCEWSFDFLKYWWTQTHYIDHPYYTTPEQDHGATGGLGGLYFEQSAFHFLYDTREDYRAVIKTVPRKWFNSIDIDNGPTFYTPGDFLVHFPGDSTARKVYKMQSYLQQKQRKKIFI